MRDGQGQDREPTHAQEWHWLKAAHRHSHRRAEARCRLGMFAALRLYAQGQRDGRRGLPSRDGDGTWGSPFIARLLDEHRQFRATQELLCARSLIPLRKQLARLDGQQALLEAEKAELRSLLLQRRAAFESQDAPPRNSAEQALDAALLHRRRRAEFEKGLAPLDERAAAAGSDLDKLKTRRVEIRTAIEQEEQVVRRDCERHAHGTGRRIAAYWQAALITYQEAPARERPPLCPPPLPALYPQGERTREPRPPDEQEPSWD